ncbi:MAG TPA: HD domain-containing protein [Bacteroidia bacterium]|nr:HD domain-containing protein [Bacteroidia bacterium]HNS12606.1 HD domain-containing protein [Bacteroidia bacterium]
MKALRLKIINDPLYGFITIPYEIVFRLIEHPYFQRLRRIRQLGMTHLVYPGAHHTRFHHAIGAMHLMGEAIDVLRSKGHKISQEEAEAVTIAILLHDIGHGPFSHALEDSIVPGISHEEVSKLFMDRLNEEFGGLLSLAITIFQDEYPKKFLHQLVSSQLDMDRLDYLGRDSFFTGVSEGVISHERIIKMLEVHNDQLAIEEKGIYSIEKFIVARRLMYWQVYLHKTVVSAECMLINILKRAREIARKDNKLFATPALKTFLLSDLSIGDFGKDPALLGTFANLDDSDITTSVKLWRDSEDDVLAFLSGCLMNRSLYRIHISNTEISEEMKSKIKKQILEKFKVSDHELGYYMIEDTIVNNAYNTSVDKINILRKDGSVLDISQAADTLNIKELSEPVVKHFLCYPK